MCWWVTYGRYEVGGGGGHSGPSGGRGVPERLGEEGPHHSIAGKEQSTTQQPQRDMELKYITSTAVYISPVNLATQFKKKKKILI